MVIVVGQTGCGKTTRASSLRVISTFTHIPQSYRNIYTKLAGLLMVTS